MSDKWDGNPRRKNDIYMVALESKVDQMFAFLRGEFGDEGLNGEKIEGRTTKTLREIVTQAKLTNGRVTSLEQWQQEEKVSKKNKKDGLHNRLNLVSICCAVICAVTAIVMIFKPK
jgi:hypothetical protein